MRALQINLSSIPSTLFLNRENKAIMFVHHGNNNFIDYQAEGIMAAWTKDSLCVGDSSYEYNKWYVIEDGSELKQYFKSVLAEPLADLG